MSGGQKLPGAETFRNADAGAAPVDECWSNYYRDEKQMKEIKIEGSSITDHFSQENLVAENAKLRRLLLHAIGHLRGVPGLVDGLGEMEAALGLDKQ